MLCVVKLNLGLPPRYGTWDPGMFYPRITMMFNVVIYRTFVVMSIDLYCYYTWFPVFLDKIFFQSIVDLINMYKKDVNK